MPDQDWTKPKPLGESYSDPYDKDSDRITVTRGYIMWVMRETARLSAIVQTVELENASLKSDLQMEKDNEDRLVREWQRANNEIHGLNSQVAALIDNQTNLKAEVERLKAVSTIEQRTIQGLQQTPEWSEIARLTAYCRELEGKVSHIDLFKSVVEKFFNSADLKNPPDAQSCYALAEKLKQLPDSILDFTEEQVRDNPAWALAVFRHKVKEMQYKRIHDLNAIGGEQEENARLKAEVERLTTQVGADAIDREHGMCCDSLSEVTRLKAEVERLRKAGDAMAKNYFDTYWALNAESTSRHEPASITNWEEAKQNQ